MFIEDKLKHSAKVYFPMDVTESGILIISNEEHPEKGIVSGHYLDKIGNHLILPKSHNCQIGNVEFKGKYDTYKYTESQLEVRTIAEQCAKENGTDIKWTISCIELRRDKIVEKLMSVFSIKE